jgi:WD40 repeat protein
LSARELFDVLDEELDRLPERHRLPLLLVYWQGLTHAEAARRLGLTPAALHGRLDRGRATLAERLTHRGFAPGNTLVLLAAPVTAAAVPRDLLAATAALAVDPWSKTVPAAVLALATANGSVKLLLTVAVGVLCAGAGLIALVGGGAWRAGRVSDRRLDSQPPVAHAPGSPADLQPAAARVDAFGDPLPAGALARLGTMRLRPGWVQFLGVAPDGQSVVTGEYGGQLRWWDVTSGQETRRQTFGAPDENGRQDRAPFAIALSPDGKIVATVEHYRGLVKGKPVVLALFDAATGQAIRRIEIELAPEPIRSYRFRDSFYTALAISSDSKWVAVGTQASTVGVWDIASGREQVRFRVPGRALAVAFSSDNSLLAVGNSTGAIQVRDTVNGGERAAFQHDGRGEILALTFASDGRSLASADGARTIYLWDVVGGKLAQRLPGHKDPLILHDVGLAYAPDGRTLASANAGGIILWDVATGSPRATMVCGSRAHFLAVTPDGQTLVSAGQETQAIRFWDLATGPERHALFGAHHAQIRNVVFAPDGRTLATDSFDRTARLWDPRTGRQLHSLEGHGDLMFGVAFSPDGTRVLTAAANESIKVWDVAPGGQVQPIAVAPFGRGWFTSAFGRDGRSVLGWSPYGGLQQVDLPDGKERFHHPTMPRALNDVEGGPKGSVASLQLSNASNGAFSADGTRFAVAMGLGVTIWDVPTGRELRHLPAPFPGFQGQATRIAFSPDGRLLIAANGNRSHVYAWEVATGGLATDVKCEELSHAIAVGPDGRTIATAEGRNDSVVRVWDLPTGNERVRFGGLGRAGVQALAISPDGGLLAAALGNTTALVWDLAPHRRPAAAASPLSDEVLQALWRDLGDTDTAKARVAVWALADGAGAAVTLLRDRIRPAVAPPEERLRQLIADLDSPRFAARADAEKELTALADLAAPALSQALAGTPSLEVRQRVEKLLKALEMPVTNAELLRQLRAVEVLEHIGTVEAQQLLRSLAGGAPDTGLTRDARASLERLKR